MGSITKIWNTRNLKQRLHRYWVRFNEEMLISNGQQDQGSVLTIGPAFAGKPLLATIKVAEGQRTQEIGSDGELVINVKNVRLPVVIRAIEESRVLVEFGVPRGDHTQIALGA